MASGVTKFSTEGRTVVKVEFSPPPQKDWEARLQTEHIKVAVANGAGKLPYVQTRIELLDSATREGGKNFLLFHNFFLDLTPSPKDGVVMVDRQNGIVAFSKAIATALSDVEVITKPKMLDTGETIQAEMLNPNQVMTWLKQFDGMVFKLHSKIDPANGNYAAKGVVDYFIESDLVNQ